MNALSKRIGLWAWRNAKRFKTPLHDLTYFFWEATLRCNLSCRHCGSDCMKDEQMPELSKEKVLSVFKDIARNYDARKVMIAVTGGEPLVRGDLFDVLAEVHALGFPWGMVTNGMLVDDAVVRECTRTGMRTVVVSLDGEKESHNRLRGNPHSYERACRALSLFAQKKAFSVVEGITCVHNENVDELDAIYATLDKTGANAWRLFTIFPKGRAAHNKELVVTPKTLTNVLHYIKRKRKEKGRITVNYSDEGYLGCAWEGDVRDYFFFCGAGINIGGLLCDGAYTACPSLSREWIQGHVDELPFSEAWETRYENMRNRTWMKNALCDGCREWKNCEASSLHLWDFAQHRPMVCHHRMLGGR